MLILPKESSFKMSSNFLIEVLSKFDINFKFFKITAKNQLNRNYGHFYWFLFCVSFSLVLFNTYILVFITDDDINSLKMFGSIGLKMVGKRNRFMIDACMVTHFTCVLVVLLSCLFDKMQDILKMSSIYEEIRTKHFDKLLMNSAKSLSVYYKFSSIIAIIFVDLLNLSVIYFNWNDLDHYPFGFIMVSIYIQFGAKIGYPLILRQMIIIIFFCRMHCFLFKSCGKYFTQLSKKSPKNHLKTCLSFHYKLCESVEELQTFLRPTFVLITSVFRPLFCYFFYLTFKNTEEQDNYSMIFGDMAAFIFFIFTIILSSMIAMIDVEAKRGAITVHGFAFKVSNKQDIFQVNSINLLQVYWKSNYSYVKNVFKIDWFLKYFQTYG